MADVKDMIIVDGHSDFPFQVLLQRRYGATKVLETQHLPEAFKAGLNLEVSIVGQDVKLGGVEWRDPYVVLEIIDCLYQEIEESPDKLQLILTKEDLDLVDQPGKFSMIFSLEGSACITSDFSMLRNYYRLGLRALSLTHNVSNIFAYGCMEPSGGGLSILGKELMAEINRHNLMLDLVHINKQGFFEALELCQNPVYVSHSNARKVNDHPRNLDDDQIRAIAERSGVIGLNCVGFIVDLDVEKQTADRYLDHMVYIADLVGVDHVGFGPDYVNYMIDLVIEWSRRNQADIKEIKYVDGISDIDEIPSFVQLMSARGFSDEDIKKIMGGNFIRVYREGLPSIG